MLTISKPISAAQAATYHAEAFSNTAREYYSTGDQIIGRWDGRLRETFGLPREVYAQHFERLANGRHPIFDTPLVRRGDVHRAGWDLTLAAPKSTSLVALVAGQDDVRRAHRAAVTVALASVERYTQARMGGSRHPETTGKWIAATFEHDSARPVDGYAAPQLHHHCVVMNCTLTASGKTRALQPREIFQAQAFGTAVYRSELAASLQALGYAVERGRSGQPEIVGFSAEYLDAASPRRKQILELLAQAGRTGAAAAEIAQKQTRASKAETLAAETVKAAHQQMAREFGDQPRLAVETATRMGPIAVESRAGAAVRYATARQFERTAVASERNILTDALRYGMGSVRLPDVSRETAAWVARGALIERPRPAGVVSPRWTTPAVIQAEQANLDIRLHGEGQARPMALIPESPGLSEDQRQAVAHVLTSRDRILAMDGVAGSGKTTTLAAIREAVSAAGYDVVGVAPTSRAAQRLAEVGIETSTLQRFLIDAPQARGHRLVIVDESSLASTTQIRTLFERMRPKDRILLVGDTRQHEAVEAGVPFRQLQDHGMPVATLTAIQRQVDPHRRMVVDQLAHGRTTEALDLLESIGQVHVIPDVRQRLSAAVEAALERDTMIVVPDNDTRQALNALVHHARQQRGELGHNSTAVRVLVPRQDMTAADREEPTMYHVGDVVRFGRGSPAAKIPARSLGTVTGTDKQTVTVTVQGRSVTYKPKRLAGVSVYREDMRQFAVGERVQFTAPDRSAKVTNRQLATIIKISADRVDLRLDSGRVIRTSAKVPLHLDYGYALTSYSAQGLTADRVILHVDADHAHEMLVNRRLVYVALSRGRTMAIYTDDGDALRRAVARDGSHPMAVHHRHEHHYRQAG